MKDEALRLALEALKHGGCPPDCKDGMTDSGGVHPWGEAALIPCPNCKAITAIEQALEQPEPEDYPTYDGYIKKALEQLNPPCKTGSQCTSKCEGCAETPVEIGVDVSSEGAHVVGMYVLPDAVRYVFYSQFHPNTSPPKRKPLTDEQKLALCKQFPDHLTFNAIKAIEAKLKEKNT